MTMTQEATYPFPSLFADIGGSLGLFLGLNLLGVLKHVWTTLIHFSRMIRKFTRYTFGGLFQNTEMIIK